MRTIGLIGAGNLGTHISKLFHRNHVNNYVNVYDIDHNRSSRLSKKYGFTAYQNLPDMVEDSDVIFLTVKPDCVKDICEELNNDIYDNKIIISTAAGVPVSKIDEWSGNYHVVLRCMPNLPISVGKGTIIWYGDERRYKIIDISMVGPQSYWVDDEELVDVATVISGCIPAYITKFYQAYLNAGIDMGFTPNMTKRMLLNAMYGTTQLLERMGPKDIIEQVASKGGATEKGLELFEKMGFDNMVNTSSYQSLDRIRKITKKITEDLD